MKKYILGFILVVGIATIADAQATRTWVSGVGDDANPCSRTAPCKTFAGAISKTAAGGTINCLDPGGYGAVTITKAIKIDCTGTIGSALVAGTNAFVVNALTTDRIILRNVDAVGSKSSQGLDGVRILQAHSVQLDGVEIGPNFSSDGIDLSNTSNQIFVAVNNCHIYGAANGIRAGSTSTGSSLVQVDDSFIGNNTTAGIDVTSANSGLQVSNSVIARNPVNGIRVSAASSGAALESVNIMFNGNGVNSTGTTRIARSMIHQNFTNGVTGVTHCFGSNVLAGNVGSNACSNPNQAQQ